jgi:hypothetical protein
VIWREQGLPKIPKNNNEKVVQLSLTWRVSCRFLLHNVPCRSTRPGCRCGGVEGINFRHWTSTKTLKVSGLPRRPGRAFQAAITSAPFASATPAGRREATRPSSRAHRQDYCRRAGLCTEFTFSSSLVFRMYFINLHLHLGTRLVSIFSIRNCFILHNRTEQDALQFNQKSVGKLRITTGTAASCRKSLKHYRQFPDSRL